MRAYSYRKALLRQPVLLLVLIIGTDIGHNCVDNSFGLTLAPTLVEERSEPAFDTSDGMTLPSIRDQVNDVRVLAAKGHTREAARALRRVLDLAKAMKDFHKRDEAYGKIALAQAEIGYFKDVKRTASSIHDATIRTEAFMLINSREIGSSTDPAKLAFLRAEVGDIRGAVEAVNRIEDSLARSYVLEGIVKQQVGAEDIEGAQQLVQFITDVAIRTTTLGIIAWTQAKENDVGGALKTLEGIDDASRDTVLVGLVESRARKRDLTGARQLAEAIHDSAKLLFAERYIQAYSAGP